MTVTETGHLDDFFRVHSSDKVMVNVLSLAEVEDAYKITYLPGEGFVVTFMKEIYSSHALASCTLLSGTM